MSVSDLEPLAVLVVAALLEGTHAALVLQIKSLKPSLLNSLGRTGPGYYFFGLFWFAPTYRRSLSSGRLRAELNGHPGAVRLSQIELWLWYSLWLVVAIVILL